MIARGALLVVACVLGYASMAFAQDPHAGHHPPSPPTAPSSAPSSDAPPPSGPLPAAIPPITDADRAAAFPDVDGHHVHDRAINTFVLLDQFEWQSGQGRHAFAWRGKSWIGGDRARVWLRSEGERQGRVLHDAQAHVLYGRSVSRWWDVVAGVRHDVAPGADRTWAAVGVQGLAPYRFDFEATAYVGSGGHTQFRFETTHDLLVTNRLVLQPALEFAVQGKADAARALGVGLASGEAGLRLRYEVRREVAPYVGVSWQRAFFGTRERIRATGGRTGGARLVVGVRWWM